MLTDNYKAFLDHIDQNDRMEIAGQLSARIKPIAKDLHGDDGDDLETILSRFFSDVCLASGESFASTSRDSYSNLVDNWRKRKSSTLAIATYYFLHTIRRGQSTAMLIDSSIFDGKSFQEQHGLAVPGGYIAGSLAGPEQQTSVELPEVTTLENGRAALNGIFPALTPARLVHGAGIRRADYSPCGKWIITSGKGKMQGASHCFLWAVDALASGYKPKVIAYHKEDIYGAVFTTDSQQIIVAAGHAAVVWQTGGHSIELATLPHRRDISSMDCSPDGKLIATAGWDSMVQLWHTRDFSPVSRTKIKLPRTHIVNAAKFSPDSKSLVIGCSDGSVIIVSVDDLGNIIRKFEGYESEGICDASFSPDGKLIAASGEVGTAGLFDVETGELIRVFGAPNVHADTTWTACFSHDQKQVVTASEDRNAAIWDVESGELVAQLVHPDSLYSAYFSKDDKTVMTACDDGRAYLWRVRE